MKAAAWSDSGTPSEAVPGTPPGTPSEAVPGTPPETAADRLKARWAEPDAAVPPRWKRVRRATWAKAGAALAALLVAGTMATVFGPDAPQRYRLDPPQTIGDLTREPDSAGRYARLDQDIFPDLPGTVRYREHFVAAYRLPGSASADFTVVGATGSFASPLGELDRLLGRTYPQGPIRGGVPSPEEYLVFPAGPLGGYLKCVGNQAGLVPACAWADQNGTTIGSVADERIGADADDLVDLAEHTRAIRAAMTHSAK